jgi:hypothetical protein
MGNGKSPDEQQQPASLAPLFDHCVLQCTADAYV